MPNLGAGLKRWIPPVVLALVFGVLTILFVNRYLQQRTAEIRKEVERQVLLKSQQQVIDVAVAAKDIPEGTTLDQTHIERGTIPQNAAQPYVARSPKEVVGLVAKAPFAAGEQILTNKLRRPDEAPTGSTLSSLTPEGKRAVTIVVDIISGVGGFVRPGDVVDVLWTIKLPQPDQPEGQVVTLTMFQEVPVLAVGRDFGGRSTAKAKESDEKDGGQFTITLALTPQETSFLLFAREQGRIQLSLRPKSETGTQVVVPANINTLMEMQLKLQPSAPKGPAASRQVEVYRGLEQNVVEVPEQQTGNQ